jgi:hypothetical protein
MGRPITVKGQVKRALRDIESQLRNAALSPGNRRSLEKRRVELLQMLHQTELATAKAEEPEPTQQADAGEEPRVIDPDVGVEKPKPITSAERGGTGTYPSPQRRPATAAEAAELSRLTGWLNDSGDWRNHRTLIEDRVKAGEMTQEEADADLERWYAPGRRAQPDPPAVSIKQTPAPPPPQRAQVDEIKPVAAEPVAPTVDEIKPVAQKQHQPMSLDELIRRGMPTRIFSKFGHIAVEGYPDYEVWEKWRIALTPSDPGCEAARVYFREGSPTSAKKNPRALIAHLEEILEWAIAQKLESQDIPILTRAGEPTPPAPDPLLSISILSCGGDPRDM